MAAHSAKIVRVTVSDKMAQPRRVGSAAPVCFNDDAPAERQTLAL